MTDKVPHLLITLKEQQRKPTKTEREMYLADGVEVPETVPYQDTICIPIHKIERVHFGDREEWDDEI